MFLPKYKHLSIENAFQNVDWNWKTFRHGPIVLNNAYQIDEETGIDFTC